MPELHLREPGEHDPNGQEQYQDGIGLLETVEKHGKTPRKSG
jgi:hypothetical protein